MELFLSIHLVWSFLLYEHFWKVFHHILRYKTDCLFSKKHWINIVILLSLYILNNINYKCGDGSFTSVFIRISRNNHIIIRNIDLPSEYKLIPLSV